MVGVQQEKIIINVVLSQNMLATFNQIWKEHHIHENGLET